MKFEKLIVLLCVFILCMAIVNVLPIHGEEKIYESVVRLHVLANSDSEEDQALKLTVRDAVLNKYGTLLNCGDKDEAEERIRTLLPAIKKTAEDTRLSVQQVRTALDYLEAAR
jgi:stage II sporulation protein R